MTAQDFITYLNENKLIPNGEGKIPFNNFYIGELEIKPDKWTFEIFNFLQFGDFTDDDAEFVETVHKQIRFCKTCHDNCWGAKDVVIFGKQFNNVCSQHSLKFENPDEKAVEHIKKLIEYSKKIVPHKEIYHCYD